MRFQGKRAVVTGGLSGIGEAVAKRIEAEGGRIAVWDMQGGIKTDISSWESVEAAAKETVRQLGGIVIGDVARRRRKEHQPDQRRAAGNCALNCDGGVHAADLDPERHG